MNSSNLQRVYLIDNDTLTTILVGLYDAATFHRREATASSTQKEAHLQWVTKYEDVQAFLNDRANWTITWNKGAASPSAG